MLLNFDVIHESWQADFRQAYTQLSPEYISLLETNTDWLPGHEAIFRAFSLPKSEVRYVLLGESPYPRAQSANGYAFWDANVGKLWSPTGLSKAVNRATSLRNFLKMLLLADGLLSPEDLSQAAIATLDKHPLVDSIDELFQNLLTAGFLLLNASPVLSKRSVAQEAKQWQGFLSHILIALSEQKKPPLLLLFGKIAQQIEILTGTHRLNTLVAQHPYNLTFIQEVSVHAVFKPHRLLYKKNSNWSNFS